jgi:hypothetical protein
MFKNYTNFTVENINITLLIFSTLLDGSIQADGIRD